MSESVQDRDSSSREDRGAEQNWSGAETSVTPSRLHSALDGVCSDDGEILFVTQHGGADVIVHASSVYEFGAEPGAPWLRVGCGSGASDSPSHAI